MNRYDDFDTQIHCEELNDFQPAAEDYEEYHAEIN